MEDMPCNLPSKHAPCSGEKSAKTELRPPGFFRRTPRRGVPVIFSLYSRLAWFPTICVRRRSENHKGTKAQRHEGKAGEIAGMSRHFLCVFVSWWWFKILLPSVSFRCDRWFRGKIVQPRISGIFRGEASLPRGRRWKTCRATCRRNMFHVPGRSRLRRSFALPGFFDGHLAEASLPRGFIPLKSVVELYFY